MGRRISTVLTVSIQISSNNQSLVSFFTSWPQLSQEITLTLELSACSQPPVARFGLFVGVLTPIFKFCHTFLVPPTRSKHAFPTSAALFRALMASIFTYWQPFSSSTTCFYVFSTTVNRYRVLHAFPASAARFRTFSPISAHSQPPVAILDFFGYLHPFSSSTRTSTRIPNLCCSFSGSTSLYSTFSPISACSQPPVARFGLFWVLAPIFKFYHTFLTHSEPPIRVTAHSYPSRCFWRTTRIFDHLWWIISLRASLIKVINLYFNIPHPSPRMLLGFNWFWSWPLSTELRRIQNIYLFWVSVFRW